MQIVDFVTLIVKVFRQHWKTTKFKLSDGFWAFKNCLAFIGVLFFCFLEYLCSLPVVPSFAIAIEFAQYLV
jgi:hypothetical protein